MNTDFIKKNLCDILCIFVVLGVCLTGIAGHDLWNPDEPRAAAISLAMAKSGDWVIPMLAGVPFVEKPPLYFAASALMIKMLGPVAGITPAIRFTSALFGLGTLLMTFLLGRRLGGYKTGLLSDPCFAASPGPSFLFLDVFITGS